MLVAGVGSMFTACQYDPWANNYLKRQPSEREIVGTYAVDAESQKRQIKLGRSNVPLPVSGSAQIILSSDHTAVFARVPANDIEQKPCSISGHGSWELGRNDRYFVVNVQLRNEDTAGGCAREAGWQLMLYGSKSPYKLHMTISDPDLADAVQFEKHS